MKISYITLILAISLSSLVLAKDIKFIAGFEDIPIAKYMTQNTDNDISFNNEETRYIETTLVAKQKQTFDEFKKFYIKTLPQLGWNLKLNSEKTLIFNRQNDILELQKLSNTPLKVSITLKNQN